MNIRKRYWANIIGQNGRVIGRVAIDGRDDASAKSRVERLVSIHLLELWDGERKIAAFQARRK